jgi:hypothetical protein
VGKIGLRAPDRAGMQGFQLWFSCGSAVATKSGKISLIFFWEFFGENLRVPVKLARLETMKIKFGKKYKNI